MQYVLVLALVKGALPVAVGVLLGGGQQFLLALLVGVHFGAFPIDVAQHPLHSAGLRS